MHKVPALVAFAVLCLPGCSSSASSGAPASPSGTGDLASSITLALQRQNGPLPTDVAGLRSQVGTLAATVERGLLATAGIDDVLGGRAKADAAYAALTKAVGERYGTSDPQTFGRFGGYVPADESLAQAVGTLFQGIIELSLAPQGLVQNSNALEPGASASAPFRDSGTQSATIDNVTFDDSASTTSGPLTAKAHTRIALAPCPGKDGKFHTSATASSSIVTNDGSHGFSMDYEFTLDGEVNDDAELANSEGHVTSTTKMIGGPPGATVTMNVTRGRTGMTAVTVRGAPTLSSIFAPDNLILQSAELTNVLEDLVNREMLKAAESGWKSGRCVSLEPTTQPSKRTGLTPGASIVITAQPKSKVDGWPVGGTIKATLSGDASVDPAYTKVPSVARFTYTAPSEKDKDGTVSLEARSKRGIAKADVSFDTKSGSYEASGGLDEFHGTGLICDLAQPFTISGSGVTQSFSPTSDKGGTYSYTGNMQGFAVQGKGSYTVKADAQGGTISATGTGTVKTPMGTMPGSGTETYTLTPTDKCK
jgi:hypothetical protein